MRARVSRFNRCAATKHVLQDCRSIQLIGSPGERFSGLRIALIVYFLSFDADDRVETVMANGTYLNGNVDKFRINLLFLFIYVLFLVRPGKRPKKNGACLPARQAAQAPRGCFSANRLRGENGRRCPETLAGVPGLSC